tara:strand:+ start:1248 stop:2045 length:798 start_codon:yes stop_codon:yes gene_type:complete
MSNQYQGTIKKLQTQLNNEVHYSLPIDTTLVELNQLINKKVKFTFLGDIYCIKCNQKIKKTFAQGYCFPCFRDAPETSECILRPELCRAHEGESRDMEWSNKHCLTNQHVYMSFTGNLKIGVTRSTQIPTRWIDQGAIKAIILCTTPNRYLAGLIEVHLKQFYSDRTHWIKMLSGKFEEPDFEQCYLEAKKYLNDGFSKYITENKWVDINYPIQSIPNKIKSFSFDKESSYEDILVGIKGQYLLFKNNRVINIRKHTGYSLKIQY